jgi:hypothetical protein
MWNPSVAVQKNILNNLMRRYRKPLKLCSCALAKRFADQQRCGCARGLKKNIKTADPSVFGSHLTLFILFAGVRKNSSGLWMYKCFSVAHSSSLLHHTPVSISKMNKMSPIRDSLLVAEISKFQWRTSHMMISLFEHTHRRNPCAQIIPNQLHERLRCFLKLMHERL